jgi:hypothetical protein
MGFRIETDGGARNRDTTRFVAACRGLNQAEPTWQKGNLVMKTLSAGCQIRLPLQDVTQTPFCGPWLSG